MAHQEHCQRVYDFLAADPSRHHQATYTGLGRTAPLPPVEEKKSWWRRLRSEGGFVSLRREAPDVTKPSEPPAPESAVLPEPVTVCTAGAAAYLAGRLTFHGTERGFISRDLDGDFDAIAREYLELTSMETMTLFSGGTSDETARAMLKAGAEGKDMLMVWRKRGCR